MKVRVKQGQKGFIYDSMRREGDEFTLESFKHPKKKDANGEPLVVSAEDQFSDTWMEKVDKPRAKPGPKPKADKED
jgi:hypothetical protein